MRIELIPAAYVAFELSKKQQLLHLTPKINT